MQYIELNGMVFHAFHGVMEQEKKVGNTFIIDLKLSFNMQKSIESDKLEDTINYATIYEIVKKEMEVPSNLLEHAAGRIIHAIKAAFSQIDNIKIRLSKRNPPIGGEIHSASVIIEQ